MNRLERLAQQKARAAEKHAATQAKLAQLAAQERAVQREALRKRRAIVGKLAEDAGLFALDDPTLAQLFAALARVVDTPDPVGHLEALFATVGGALDRTVEGMAQPPAGVARAVPVGEECTREVAAQLPSSVPLWHQQ
jgi:hypothetical protein